jgi:hypothetical protein
MPYRFLLALILFAFPASAQAVCWRMPGGEIVETASVSKKPGRGARVVDCPKEKAAAPAKKTEPAPVVTPVPTPSKQTAITLPHSFTAYSQLNADDARLYSDPAWAKANDTVAGSPRINWTCLAVVYAMIEHARGNSSYRINAQSYSDTGGGAAKIGGVSAGPSADLSPPSFAAIEAELRKGNPVILRGNSRRLGVGHYVLAIGIDRAGQIVALDPYGGKKISVDPVTWETANSDAGKLTVISYRKVAF